MTTNQIWGDEEWSDGASAGEINTRITDMVAGANNGSLTKEEVLKFFAKVADRRKDPSLLLEVEHRLGLPQSKD